MYQRLGERVSAEGGRCVAGEEGAAADAAQQQRAGQGEGAGESGPGETEAEKEGRHSGRGRSRKAVVAYDTMKAAGQWTNKTDEEKEEERERKNGGPRRGGVGATPPSDEDGLSSNSAREAEPAMTLLSIVACFCASLMGYRPFPTR